MELFEPIEFQKDVKSIRLRPKNSVPKIRQWFQKDVKSIRLRPETGRR